MEKEPRFLMPSKPYQLSKPNQELYCGNIWVSRINWVLLHHGRLHISKWNNWYPENLAKSWECCPEAGREQSIQASFSHRAGLILKGRSDTSPHMKE